MPFRTKVIFYKVPLGPFTSIFLLGHPDGFYRAITSDAFGLNIYCPASAPIQDKFGKKMHLVILETPENAVLV